MHFMVYPASEQFMSDSVFGLVESQEKNWSLNNLVPIKNHMLFLYKTIFLQLENLEIFLLISSIKTSNQATMYSFQD